MSAQNTPRIVIRDAVEADVIDCMALEAHYSTQQVWQMQIYQDERQGWDVSFKVERLPRLQDVKLYTAKHRLEAALPESHCFLVAQRRDTPEILGFLAMSVDVLHGYALIHDLVVGEAYRRMQIGTRLFATAHVWAKEHKITRITAETQTKNMPSILFWQKLGFQFCGFNDRHLYNQDIAVFFSITLR
jgi:ribosomal protein S18 acetylase RimI-like enzyme